jgi:tetratricopeptide (TPR) repeat protein
VFSAFIENLPDFSERCLFNIKYHLFGKALNHYLTLFNENELNDPEILMRIGRCHKGRGNYEYAIEFLESASQQKRDDPDILAELADCYSLVNETRAAKVFFREAFFLGPGRIKLSYLESPMIQRLIGKLKKLGYAGSEILEWIPVYGTIYGLFSVKRELRPLEIGKLKQSIYQLEKEIELEKERIPQLINRYFWLIDHYVNTGEEREKIDEVLDKIKAIDPHIHNEYIN